MHIVQIKSISLLALAVTGVLSAPAYAAADESAQLDAVIVTGTRTEVALRDSLVPAQVIDRDEIERSQAHSLQELLQGRAGISIANQGGLGKLTTISMRGTESDHVLVMVDGMRIGSATAGLASFQDLPLAQIDRIEIVRGPRSSLYGSEAIGGVIQIFTRRDHGKLRPHFQLGLGSQNYRQASVGIGAGNAHGWFAADLAYQRIDGINSCLGSSTLFQGCFVEESDRDGYRNQSVNVRGGIEVTEQLKLEGNFLHAAADNEFDGSVFAGNQTDNVQQVAGIHLQYTPSARWNLQFNLGSTADKSDNRYINPVSNVSTGAGVFDTRRDTASIQADIALTATQLLSIGADWQNDRVTSDTNYDVKQRNNLAEFVQYQGKFDAHRIELSLRSDDNEQFGQHTTGSAGYGYKFANDVQFTLNYSTGFKAPTFNDLYFPFFNNPNLRPETSASLNIGLNQHFDTWGWTLNAYETKIEDLIGFDNQFNIVQFDQARIRGAEWTLNTQLAGWDIATQFSHIDPRNRSVGANYNNLLARRARNTGRIDLDRKFGGFHVGATLNAASHRFDNAANSDRLGGYSTLDFRAEYSINPSWTLLAKVSNAFDHDYETVNWYAQSGREYGLSVRYQPVD